MWVLRVTRPACIRLRRLAAGIDRPDTGCDVPPGPKQHVSVCRLEIACDLYRFPVERFAVLENDMSVIEVQAPGLLTTVQDLGREGFGPIGVSPQGQRIPFHCGLETSCR